MRSRITDIIIYKGNKKTSEEQEIKQEETVKEEKKSTKVIRGVFGIAILTTLALYAKSYQLKNGYVVIFELSLL